MAPISSERTGKGYISESLLGTLWIPIAAEIYRDRLTLSWIPRNVTGERRSTVKWFSTLRIVYFSERCPFSK